MSAKRDKYSDRCTFHEPMSEKLGYIDWHSWAEKQTEKQIQCKECKQWFWPSEFGVKK